MDSKYWSAHLQLLISAAFFGMLLLIIYPTGAYSMEDFRPEDWEDIEMIGIISPDGRPSLWAVSTSSGADILGMLAERPSQIKDGTRYYRLTSWKDLANVLTALYYHQSRIIHELAQDLHELNTRVDRIEKKRRTVVNSHPIDYRLKKLEKTVELMLDGGNP